MLKFYVGFASYDSQHKLLKHPRATQRRDVRKVTLQITIYVQCRYQFIVCIFFELYVAHKDKKIQKTTFKSSTNSNHKNCKARKKPNVGLRFNQQRRSIHEL